jgi:gamma-glutamylcyclotransferase
MDCWYFAYGSNLLTRQMEARTGVHTARQAFLPGHRVAFNMDGGDGQVYANIVQPGDGVHGVIYCCGPDAMSQLDQYEHGYARHTVTVRDAGGADLSAVTYIAQPQHTTAEARPSAAYLQKILAGAREHGLPDAHIGTLEAMALD